MRPRRQDKHDGDGSRESRGKEKKRRENGLRPARARTAGTYHEEERHEDTADNNGTTEGVGRQRGKNSHHDEDDGAPHRSRTRSWPRSRCDLFGSSSKRRGGDFTPSHTLSVCCLKRNGILMYLVDVIHMVCTEM